MRSASLFFLVATLFCLVPPSLLANHGIYTHNLLIIHSYHPDMQWVKEVQQALDDTLIATLGESVDIKVEYMDSKCYASAESYALLANLWHHKYAQNKPDILIVCDDNALNQTFKWYLFAHTRSQ